MKLYALLFIGVSSAAVYAYDQDSHFIKQKNSYQYQYIMQDFRHFFALCDYNPQLALFKAVKNGSDAFIEIILWQGVDIDGYNNEGKTALMCAAERGYTEICEILLEYGASIDARTNWGSTALMWAAENGHAQTCAFLIEEGASVHATTYQGKTALDYARNESVKKVLRKAGAQKECYCKPDKSNTHKDEFGAFCLSVAATALFAYWMFH